MLGTKNVCAIVVTYNPDVEVFNLVLSSIVNQVDKVIVVDNCSITQSDISAVIVDNKIRFIKLSENVGLASAQNIVINIAREEGFSHVVLFDQDSVISDSFISSLLACENDLLDAGHQVAAVGPSFFDPVSGLSYPATRYRGPFIDRVALADAPIEATFIIASGCLIRMDVLAKVGLMLDDLFIDYIDVEWSLRAKSKGYSVFISPHAKMAHAIGDRRVSVFGRTISVHSPIRRYYLFRNSFYMIKLPYVPIGYKVRECVFNLIRFLAAFAFSDSRGKIIKYSLFALNDAIHGKYGKFNHE